MPGILRRSRPVLSSVSPKTWTSQNHAHATPFDFRRRGRGEKAGRAGALAGGSFSGPCGQPALTNTLANDCEAAATLFRLQNASDAGAGGGGPQPARIEPGGAFGRAVLELLAQRRTELVAAAGGGGGGGGGSGQAAGGLALLAAGYPTAAAFLDVVSRGFSAGHIRLWLVPFGTFNPDGCPPQVGVHAWVWGLLAPARRSALSCSNATSSMIYEKDQKSSAP
jgi:hypothetical protein